jgi:hypothetical protein
MRADGALLEGIGKFGPLFRIVWWSGKALVYVELNNV